MRKVVTTVLTAACLLAFAGAAGAQALKVNPRIGLYAPLTDLADAESTAGTIAAEQSGALALGLGVEFGFLPLDIRANLDYVTGAEVTVDGVSGAEESKMLAVSADLMFRPLPRLIVLQPYVFAGVGLRQYEFEPADASVSQLRDADDATIHLGGGLDLALGTFALNAELGDYISWYAIQDGADAKVQHDVFISLGIILGLL